MNFIKKFFLKRKLKKKLKLVIDSIITFSEDFGSKKESHFICICLYNYGINKNDLPNFNLESFSLFIKKFYPQLTPYLNEHYHEAWMRDRNGYYPDEQITEAKKAFLTYIIKNL